MTDIQPAHVQQRIRRVLDDPMVRAIMAADSISDAAMIAVMRGLVRDLADRRRAGPDAALRLAPAPASWPGQRERVVSHDVSCGLCGGAGGPVADAAPTLRGEE